MGLLFAGFETGSAAADYIQLYQGDAKQKSAANQSTLDQ